MNYQTIIIAYLAIISILSVIICIYDKWAATNRPKKRTRESTLLLLSALGGSVAMLLTMYFIRHKTQHKKFMVGIPLIIIVQLLAILGISYLFH